MRFNIEKPSQAVGPRLKWVLHLLLGLFGLLTLNSVYLLCVRVLEGTTSELLQNRFYVDMFLLHLLIGLLITAPLVVFALLHLRNVYRHPNVRAIRVGLALLAAVLLLLASGLVLARFKEFPALMEPGLRKRVFILHLICPLAVIGLFIAHRLTGPPIKWKIGLVWLLAALLVIAAMVVCYGFGSESRNGQATISAGQPALTRGAGETLDVARLPEGISVRKRSLPWSGFRSPGAVRPARVQGPDPTSSIGSAMYDDD